MKILKESEKLLSYAGLSTALSVSVGGKIIPQILLHLTFCALLMLCMILECILGINGYADNIVSSLYPLCVTITLISAMAVYVVLIWKSNKISELYENLENVIEQSK